MNFPIELFFLISSFCDNYTFLKLIQLNKSFYDLFHPFLKKKLINHLHNISSCPLHLISQLSYIESKLFLHIIKYIPLCKYLNHIRFTNSFISKNSFKLYFDNYSINIILFCDLNLTLFNSLFSSSQIIHPLYKRPISFLQHIFPLSHNTSLINSNNSNFSMLFFYVL